MTQPSPKMMTCLTGLAATTHGMAEQSRIPNGSAGRVLGAWGKQMDSLHTKRINHTALDRRPLTGGGGGREGGKISRGAESPCLHANLLG